MTKGPAASLKRPPQNIGHCKWVPAFAGMKRSGGDAGATEEMDACMRRLSQERSTIRPTLECNGKGIKRSTQKASMKHYVREGKGIHAIRGIRGFCFCLFVLDFVFVFNLLSLPETRDPRPGTRLLRICIICVIRGCLFFSFVLSFASYLYVRHSTFDIRYSTVRYSLLSFYVSSVSLCCMSFVSGLSPKSESRMPNPAALLFKSGPV